MILYLKSNLVYEGLFTIFNLKKIIIMLRRKEHELGCLSTIILFEKIKNCEKTLIN